MRVIDYFDRAYVIHRPGRTDRHRAIARDLDRLGMPLGQGRVEAFPALQPEDDGGFRSAVVHGDYLSHLALLQQALQSDLECVLIMEDDLHIAPEFAAAEPRMVEQLVTNEWSFVYFGHFETHAPPRQPTLIPYGGPLIGAHFYGVHRSVLAPLVEFLEALRLRSPSDPQGGPMDIDDALTTFRLRNRQVQTLLAAPNLARQRLPRDETETFYWFDRAPGLRRIAHFARGRHWLPVQG